jgi:hypothetical protein
VIALRGERRCGERKREDGGGGEGAERTHDVPRGMQSVSGQI